MLIVPIKNRAGLGKKSMEKESLSCKVLVAGVYRLLEWVTFNQHSEVSVEIADGENS